LCNSCASLAGLVLSFIACFIACFILLVIAPLARCDTVSILLAVRHTDDMIVVGVMDDVQYSRHCVGQQQSKL